MDSLHGQLGRLLNDAQALLADIAPGASGSQFGKEIEYFELIQNDISSYFGYSQVVLLIFVSFI